MLDPKPLVGSHGTGITFYLLIFSNLPSKSTMHVGLNIPSFHGSEKGDVEKCHEKLQAHWVDWDAEEAGSGSGCGFMWVMGHGWPWPRGTWLKGGIFDTETSTSYISDTIVIQDFFPSIILLKSTQTCSSSVKQPNHSETPTNFYLRFLLGLVGPGCWTMLCCCCCQESFPPRTVATLSCRFCVQCTAGCSGPWALLRWDDKKSHVGRDGYWRNGRRETRKTIYIVLIPINME